MADAGDRGKASLALVSVLATAALGIAGLATTLLISRDQRATERANRIYERRAAAYVGAFDTLERHVSTLGISTGPRRSGPPTRVPTRPGDCRSNPNINDETDIAQIRSRLVAFGSTEAIAALDRVGALDKKAFALVLADTQPTGQPDRGAWTSNASQAIDDLRVGITEFETRLNRELTS